MEVMKSIVDVASPYGTPFSYLKERLLSGITMS